MNRNRILGVGLAAAIGLGALAAPSMASAQIARHRRNEEQHRTNAYALGAAGLILMNQHQSTLGTVALAGAAYEAKRMQDEIDARHRQYGNRGYYDRNGRWRTGSSQSTNGYYDSNGRWHSYNSTSNRDGYYDSNGNWHSYNNSSSNGYYDRNGNWHSYNTGSYNNGSRDGYYDQNGRWHSYNNSNSGYYDRNGNWHSYNNDRYNNDRYNRDHDRDRDCDDNDRRDNRRGREWAATRGNKRGWDHNGKRGN